VKDPRFFGHVEMDGRFTMRELTFDEQWFRRLFEDHHQDLLGYAARRVASLEDANDVVSEVFAVAWRRRAVIPASDEQARMWLYGVAHRTLGNTNRSNRRWNLLPSRLVSVHESVVPDHAGSDDESDLHDAYRALAALRPDDREILLLSLWEDLSVSQIAAVMGLRAGNVSVRLHRAKARLRREFLHQVKDQPAGGHVELRAHGDVAPERT
jgi:RNA polymerase sigma-70 factor (ECF subfamily)